MEESADRRIVLGRIAGLHGLRGWVKVISYTEPRANILAFPRWQLRLDERWESHAVTAGQENGGRVLAQLDGVTEREHAAPLVGADIAVMRAELPAAAAGEYYWSDLEGLTVVNVEGHVLGTVARLFATGANDVMVVSGERERLVPFVAGRVVIEVDLAQGRIRVDWDAGF